MLGRAIAHRVLAAAAMVPPPRKRARMAWPRRPCPRHRRPRPRPRRLSDCFRRGSSSPSPPDAERTGRYLAVNAQLLTVSASYGRPSGHGLYLHSEDAERQPRFRRRCPRTAATRCTMASWRCRASRWCRTRFGFIRARRKLNRVFLDPRRKFPAAKLTQEDIFKAFVSADERYARISGRP